MAVRQRLWILELSLPDMSICKADADLYVDPPSEPAVKINSAGAAKSRTLPHKAFIYTLARCEYVENEISPAEPEDNTQHAPTVRGLSLSLSLALSPPPSLFRLFSR